MNKMSETIPSRLKAFYNEFSGILNIDHCNFNSDIEFVQRCSTLVNYLSGYQLCPLYERERAFLAHINWKFRINSEHLAVFYAGAAKLGHTFNYHRKSAIQRTFDRDEIKALPEMLHSFNIPPYIIDELAGYANCESRADTLKVIHEELNAPSKLRREMANRDIRLEILKTLFASFLWVSLPQRDMHRFFDEGFDEERYKESFWEELQLRSPRLFHRDDAVHFLAITNDWAEQFSAFNSFRDIVLSRVRESYDQLNNYGFLIVLLPNIYYEGRDVSWELAADITLFGEKHLERPLDRAYFKHDRIQAETLDHIPELNIAKARFDLVNEGLTYRDCFILSHQETKHIDQLLVFQKNHRDETIVPCPTCRTNDVEGNSYPSLGVKSWECRNPLCPDRSKYNRGKRYSFRGLAMQQAIDDARNDVPPEFVKLWRRDVVEIANYQEVLELIVRHYSIWGDKIKCFGELTFQPANLLGRSLYWAVLPAQSDGSAATWFINAALFRRYGIKRSGGLSTDPVQLGDDQMRVFCGDSRHVLQTFENGLIDGAVTSPPYYNAREYSQWPNIYCYLQDMFDVNAQVFRVLKPGGLYFYNIFDYFDNENIVALSAMGQKRITLSAFTIDLFRRIGFECVGNVAWDKGEIEGKRGFNAGNFSPFYQSPFNCWEHVLVFRKPGGKSPDFGGSRVLPVKPVMKMIKGKNVHGHSAPFPEDIPMLCIETLPVDSLILDPFAGSLTTGRTAVETGRRAICIEKSRKYCDLGLSLYLAMASAPSLQMGIEF